ncbi:asparagine synthase [Streptomyces sp. 1114.5]|uniref:asparagine synthase-related protein n=1 Tax=Streptomyces sp. 1114.5 TaxID=1938830 RepID=UPI000EACD469|nr:asparagine synthase-related protein [Streptomyces sp. 1114.5]RKT19010.1 asparagine synthase [Streptomyces sp. 1114.5]
MNTFPSLLLDVRSERAGLVIRLDGAGQLPDTGRLVVEEFGRGQALPSGGVDDCNTVEWTGEQVTVRTSRQNPTILRHWQQPGTGRVLIGTDLAELTARAIALQGARPDRVAQIRAVRASIRAIGGGRTVVLSRSANGGPTAITETVSQSWQAAVITGESAVEAGARQIETLRREIAASGTPGPVTAIVSGGVDSGLVAALAQQAGILDHLATLGTPWGDEYAAADELGAHLGLPVRHLALSEEDILRAIPETVRMLGVPNREMVAGGVNLVAVYRQGGIPAGTVLTGVGADFINSGLRTEAGTVPDLQRAVAQCLADAAAAGELSGAAAAAYGYTLRHMYWNTPVIQAALDTDPLVMRHRDREKGHMRVAAEALLPPQIAWRPKQALHHGSGVQANLDGAVARLIGRAEVDVERFYELVATEQAGALVDSPHEPIDSDKCLEAAVAAYVREYH